MNSPTVVESELGHAAQPAEAGGAVEEPLQFAVRGDLCLIEQDGFGRIDPAGNQRRRHFAGVGGEFGWHMRLADGVEIGQKEEAFAAGGRGIVLHGHPVADRAQIVAEVEIAGGLDAGNDAHGGSLC